MKTSKISDESKALHKLFRDGEIDHETLEDSMSGLALLPPPETALDVYSKTNGLDPYLDAVFDKVAEFQANKPSLETEKGRKEYRSMARKVASFKTAIDNMGKEVNDRLKLVPKLVDAERRRVWDKLESLQKEIVQPVVEWEAEQDRIEAERLAKEAEAEAQRLAQIAAKELQEQVDRDHELAIFMYADYLRQKEEAAKQAIIDAENAAKAQKEREEQIAKEAAENARIAAEKAAADELARKEVEAKAAIERAEREKVEAENARLRQEQQAKEAAAKAEQDRIAAIAKAEADKLAAIEAERKRQADEKAAAEAEALRREKDTANKKRVNNEILADLLTAGISEEVAKLAITAIEKGQIRNVKINY